MKASAYKELLRKKKGAEALTELELPSGFVWKVRKFPMDQYIAAGNLPTFLAAQIKSGATSPEEIAEQIEANQADIWDSLDFMRKVVVYCAVEPRIASNPQNDDEIAPEEIDPEDFQVLQDWCMSGGQARLNSFRAERQQPSVAGSGGARKRNKSK